MSVSRCKTQPPPAGVLSCLHLRGSGKEHRTELIVARREQWLDRELAGRLSLRTACFVLASTACYYIATHVAWALTFPDSKVSLFFPPQAVLLCVLLVVPTRHWWAYILAAVSAHFLATQQAGWPTVYALTCEAFDAVKCVSAAAGVRILIRSPLTAITLRDAIVFVLIAVVVVPFGTALWGASFTVSYGFGTRYWVEWRNLGISNAVTTIVLVPVILLGAHHLFIRRQRALSLRREMEAVLVGACTVAVGIVVFDRTPAGPSTSPALLYAPIPLLIWAALRFGPGGISASMLIITFQAIWGTMRGHGPFLAQTPAENAMALQLFLLVTATPLMLLAVVIDEERRSKEALRENASLMGLAAEAGNLAMWVWDVSGNHVWMTERGRSLFGLEPGAPLDFAATFDRVHPEDRAARDEAIARTVRTRGEYDVEYRLQQADGMARWIHGRGRCAATEDGAGPKLFGVSMDVTARKEAEAAAAQKRTELEHVARVATLGELTTTLTHELRQPLAAILTSTYVGERLLDAPEPDLPKVRSTLADISEVTRRAGDVVAGLRSMLKRGGAATDPTSVDVNDVIRIVERIAHGDANLHKVSVHLELSPHVRTVRGDSVQLQQVILNLMLNGFSAMSGAGPDGPRRLVVRTTSIDRSNLLIEVQDSGTGIAGDKLESIFEPFVTSKPEGLGIGLSICRSIIERHGGRISAANNPDRGATFSIALPGTLE
jgi:two-component system, LuxR family, sensor kinase FixL